MRMVRAVGVLKIAHLSLWGVQQLLLLHGVTASSWLAAVTERVTLAACFLLRVHASEGTAVYKKKALWWPSFWHTCIFTCTLWHEVGGTLLAQLGLLEGGCPRGILSLCVTSALVLGNSRSCSCGVVNVLKAAVILCIFVYCFSWMYVALK